ncbi:MAG: hypothetical protein DRI24_22925, partial [Deltaproteobacteria bacterium]
INLHQSRLNGKKAAPKRKIREKRSGGVENRNRAKAQETAILPEDRATLGSDPSAGRTTDV